jgi:hypothetical protein
MEGRRCDQSGASRACHKPFFWALIEKDSQYCRRIDDELHIANIPLSVQLYKSTKFDIVYFAFLWRFEGALRYAGFWTRFGSQWVDVLVLLPFAGLSLWLGEYFRLSSEEAYEPQGSESLSQVSSPGNGAALEVKLIFPCESTKAVPDSLHHWSTNEFIENLMRGFGSFDFGDGRDKGRGRTP